MKRICKPIILFVLGMSFFVTSCNYDVDNYQNIPTDNAYETKQDVQNGMIGAYNALGTYRFYGMNVVAIGDMASDVAQGSASSGHFYNLSNYIVSDADTELKEVWEYGYQVVDRCVRTIQGGQKILNSGKHQSEANKAYINLYISQSYALRALANFTLVNVFSLPYHAGTSNLGIALLVDKPLDAFQNIQRSTVGESYTQILSDIADAKKFMDEALDAGIDEPNGFYMNRAAVYALEARVRLHMRDFTGAKSAAQTAITLRGGIPMSNDAYILMWSSLAISDEDIFTIAKTQDDNLSANSINTLYGSYKGSLTTDIIKLFQDTDIRSRLINKSNNHPMKFDGIPTSQSVSNIPVFRISEMYLIIAEAEAQAGNISLSQNALFFTAKRNTAITAADQLPSTKSELLAFISQERVREFFQEGYRYYDVRRTGEKITVASGGNNATPNFDVSKFVYPIPLREVNSGAGIVQNPKWSDALPKK